MESILVYPKQGEVSDAVTDKLRQAADLLRNDKQPPQHPANVAAGLLREMYVGGSALADYVGNSLGEHITDTLGLTPAKLHWNEEDSIWTVHWDNGTADVLYGVYASYQQMLDAMQVHMGMAVWADDEDTLDRIHKLNLLDDPAAERLRGEALVARVKEIMQHRAVSITSEGDGGGRAADLAAVAIYRAADVFCEEDLNEEDGGTLGGA